MDSLFKILRYIFLSNKRRAMFDSVESFFKDGKSFPTFISIIFNIDEIPGVRNNIKDDADVEANNNLALQFLFQKNKEISDLNPTLDDQFNLLKLILTKQYFKLTPKHIFSYCNSRLKEYGIKFETEKELLNVKNLITLIRAINEEEIPIDDDDDDDNDEYINDLLASTFEKAKIPLILDSTTLNDQNQFIFYIQVEMIFNEFMRISKQNSASDSSQNILLNDIPKEKKHSKFFNIFKRRSNDPNYSSDTTEYESDDEDEKENEDLQNIALLKTLNAIGKKFNITFDSFENAVKNDAIPKFVMKFFNCKTIENVDIQEEENKTNSRIISGRLSENQIKNIEAVIEFIKKKKEKFKILLFDFRDIKNIEASTISFYTNFLNCFFIRTLKQEMYSRIVKLLCSHTSKFNEKYNDLLFTKYKIYPCLLHFIVKGDLHFPFDYHKKKFTDKDAEPYFTNAKVPMIINKDLLLYSKKYVSCPIFYQLQFIFDALERSSTSCFVVEYLMNTFFHLKTIKVPKYNEIAVSITVKQRSLEMQEKMGKEYRDKIELKVKDYVKKERKEITKPKTFNDICKEQKDLITKMKDKISSNKDEEDIKIEPKSYDEFWNSPDPEYINEKGIIYNKKESNKKESSQNWTNEFAEIVRKSIEEKKKNEKDEKNENKPTTDNKYDGMAKSPTITNRRKSGYETRLYKIFTYDEQNQKWIFNSEVFEFFAKEKKINVNDSKTPLILFFNSYEDDLIALNSKLINTAFPDLDFDSDDIFVYPLCDRSLTMLNFYVDFNNNEKASIKPIFLLLHIPKNFENHPKLRLIVTQMYSFLSTVCDLEVTILNRNLYLEQVKYIKSIININECFELNSAKGNDEKPPFSFVYQSPSPPLDSTVLFTNKNSSNKFIYKKPRFVFLVNDSTAQFTNEFYSEFNNSKFFKNIVSRINKEKYLYYINVDDTETYESFLDCMNDTIMNNKCCTFDEIQSNFQCIENCYFSDFYLQIITKDYYYDDLEKLINQRLKMMKAIESSTKEKESDNDEDKEPDGRIENKKLDDDDDKKSDDEYEYEYEESNEEEEKKEKKKKKGKGKDKKNKKEKKVKKRKLTMFEKEVLMAVPNDNTYFINDCIAITKLLDNKEFCNETIRDTLRENLQICADSHLLCIEQSINQKYFWTYQQMADMIRSHKIFIKNEFLSIINCLFEEKLIETIFTFNFDVLEKQLLKDKIRIMDAMQPFIDKIKIKNCPKVQDLRNTMKEGTNYAMKETENLREIRVEVQIDKDLTDVIPQDF